MEESWGEQNPSANSSAVTTVAAMAEKCTIKKKGVRLGVTKNAHQFKALSESLPRKSQIPLPETIHYQDPCVSVCSKCATKEVVNMYDNIKKKLDALTKSMSPDQKPTMVIVADVYIAVQLKPDTSPFNAVWSSLLLQVSDASDKHGRFQAEEELLWFEPVKLSGTPAVFDSYTGWVIRPTQEDWIPPLEPESWSHPFNAEGIGTLAEWSGTAVCTWLAKRFTHVQVTTLTVEPYKHLAGEVYDPSLEVVVAVGPTCDITATADATPGTKRPKAPCDSDFSSFARDEPAGFTESEMVSALEAIIEEAGLLEQMKGDELSLEVLRSAREASGRCFSFYACSGREGWLKQSFLRVSEFLYNCF